MSTQPDSSHVQHLISEPPAHRSVSFLLGLGILLLPIIFVWFLLRAGHSTLSRVVGFGWLALCVLVAIIPSAPPAVAPSSAPDVGKVAPEAPPADIMKVTALELARAYEANEVAAQQAYGGRPLEVTGVVTGVTLDFMDRPTLQLEGSNQFLGPQAQFDKGQANKLSAISKGQTVTFRCEEVSEVVSAPILSGCSF